MWKWLMHRAQLQANTKKYRRPWYTGIASGQQLTRVWQAIWHICTWWLPVVTRLFSICDRSNCIRIIFNVWVCGTQKVQCMTYKVRLHAIKQVYTAKRIWRAGLPGRPEHGQGCQHRHPPAGPRAVAGAQCGAHPCEAAASTAFSVTPSGKLGFIAAGIMFYV